MRFPHLSAAALTPLLSTAFALSAALSAQTPGQAPRPIPFGPDELNCSSYLTAAPPVASARIAGNAGAVQYLQLSSGDLVQLTDAHGLQPGMELRILRIDDHWGEFEQFRGQDQQLQQMGHRVVSVGRLQVLNTRGTTALARVEAACRPVQAGDFGIPWEPRTAPAHVTAPPLDVTRMPAPEDLAGAGLVAATRDSAYEAGPDDEIYLNRGTRQGVHAGQVWLIVRGPLSPSQQWLKDVARELGRPGYGTSFPMPNYDRRDGLPHVVGQAVILWAEPASATAIVTDADSAIYPGDQILPLP